MRSPARSTIEHVVPRERGHVKVGAGERGEMFGVGGRSGHVRRLLNPARGMWNLNVADHQVRALQGRARQIKKRIRLWLIQNQIANQKNGDGS
jgi:hypothetical protein